MCWGVRHADILILLHAGSVLAYGSKEGCLALPLPPAGKSNAFSAKDFGPFYTIRVRPLVIAGPLSPSHVL